MKLVTLSLLALFSINTFAQDVEQLDVARLTFVVKRTLKIPGPATHNDLLPMKTGLPVVKGKPACALSVIPAEIQLTRMASGTTFGIQGIVKDPFSDSHTYIVAPDGIFGLAITCVKKLKSVDAATGTLLASKTSAPLHLAEMREALKGVIEVLFK
jgi:hypothetical protein